MKAIEINKLVIKCDSCEFNTEGNPAGWHNKDCPACGAPNIIDDVDLKALEGLMAMVNMANKAVGDVADGHYVEASFDSAALKPDSTTQ